MTKQPNQQTVEHGPQAFYSSDGERYCPVIDCLCEWTTGRQFNWEECGALFDQHLEQVK